MWIIPLYLFIVGLFFGSFFNVCAERLSCNESIIKPGSHCENCNHQLSWYELIPVFSYIFQKGRCKYCHIKLSIQYPLTELITGLLYMCSYFIFGFTYNTLISLVVVSVVIITFISDSKYMVILDEVLITGEIFLPILIFLDGGINYLIHSILSGFILFGIMLLIKLFGDKTFKQESLGWGDVKLSLFAGSVLGIKLGIIYIFLASIIALPYALISTKKNKTNILPFGPFLVLSLIIIFWNSNLFNFLLNMLIGGY